MSATPSLGGLFQMIGLLLDRRCLPDESTSSAEVLTVPLPAEDSDIRRKLGELGHVDLSQASSLCFPRRAWESLLGRARVVDYGGGSPDPPVGRERSLAPTTGEEHRILRVLRRHRGRMRKRALQQSLWRMPAARLNPAIESLVEQGRIRWDGDFVLESASRPVG